MTGVLVRFLVPLAAASGLLTACVKCIPLGCPLTLLEPTLIVEAPDGGLIDGVAVLFADGGEPAMTCGDEGYCAWNYPGIEGPGTFYLEVSAQGFQTAAIVVSATTPLVPQSNGCPGCRIAMLTLAAVTLQLAPDGGS